MSCTVNSCCCGCSLRTGTIILLVLSTLGSVYQLLTSFSGHAKGTGILTPLIVLVICGLAFYGLREDRPSYLIPFAVVEMVGGILLTLFSLICIVARQYVIDYLKEEAKASGTPYTPEQVQQLNSMFFIVIVFCLIFAALQYYYFVVVYSFYKKLREEKRSPVTHA